MNPFDTKLEVGDVVQVDPETDRFGACLVVVTEIKAWGIQGYVKAPGEDGGLAFIRLNFDKIEYVGKAVWTRA